MRKVVVVLSAVFLGCAAAAEAVAANTNPNVRNVEIHFQTGGQPISTEEINTTLFVCGVRDAKFMCVDYMYFQMALEEARDQDATEL